jgi:membrane protease YdiL (CAAX protease family)
MATPSWGVFGTIAVLVTVAVVALAGRTASALDEDADVHRLPPVALLANVVLSQGLFGALLLLGALYAAVPPSALGLASTAFAGPTLAVGAVAGAALYAGDEVLAATLRRAGVAVPETLRGLLAPDSVREWVVLLVGVLPVVAGFEELLFRGALVGALSAGTPLPAWMLAVASSALFGLAHGAQGRPGMVVATLLGLALAGLFLATRSLPAVVLAHYVVNALEFVVHER